MRFNQLDLAARLVLVVCLSLGFCVYIPSAGQGQVVLADDPPPPVEDAAPSKVIPPSPTPSPTDRDAELYAGLAALELARQQGPEAVLALGRTLHGKALDLAMDDIVAAHQQLALKAPPRPATPPVSEAEELAALQAQAEVDAANRARALAPHDDPAEDKSPTPNPQSPTTPNAPAADLTVGAGCDYATIAAAMAAAGPGDRLLIEGGRTFTENLTIPISLTLQGGYTGCVSGSSAPTTINGGGAGRVIEILADLTVTLENLNIVNGNVAWGGGIRVYSNSSLKGTNLEIANNTATAYGGGVRLWGGSATFTNTNIRDNIAPIGAGVYGTFYNSYAPALNLPYYADVHSNAALTGDGLGGGVYMSQGTISLTDCSDIDHNDAIEGGGIYLVTSTLTIRGDCSEIMYNTATGNGGGIRAQGSTINLDLDAELFNNTAGYGGGAYLDNSNLRSDKALIHHNTANSFGGGVYAGNNSLLDMDLGGYACAGPRCSQLSYNTAGSYGGGTYATSSSEIDLHQVFVENNSADYGGGAYAFQSPVYLYNDLFAGNDATGGAGDGIRLFTGSSLTGTHNTLAHNDAGGAATGNAIGMSGAALALQNSVIWGHASSVDLTGQTITCSDIQGGYTGADNMDVDPLYVNPASANFHLQHTSPVIDRCATGETRDFDDEPRPVTYVRPGTPYDMGADEASVRVGINGAACAYGRIRDAVDAAASGDTIQAAADVFSETVEITKTLTIIGGYDVDCTTYITGATTVNGGGVGSVFTATNSVLTLRNLNITGGDTSTGGGVNVQGGNAQVTLDNTDVFSNQASYGGGIYVATGSVLTLTNDSDISNNTAITFGGGARVWGKLVGADTLSDIYENTAPHGGGISAMGEVILIGADVQGNLTTAADSRGGGIQLEPGSILTMTASAWVFENQAYDGAGIYANNATIFMSGSNAIIRDNIATHNGGGLYLTGDSYLYVENGSIGDDSANVGNEAEWGAGVYAVNSTIEFSGQIFNNVAATGGGGLYAESSTVNLTNAYVGNTGANKANQVTGGVFGAGLFFSATHALLSNTVVASNTFSSGAGWGAGVVARDGSVLTLTNNSRIEYHYAPNTGILGGTGAGLLVYSSTATLDNSQVLSNTADIGGGGIYMLETSTLNVLNGSSIAYNHAVNGAGGGIAATDDPDINISDSTLQGNTAGTDGGAVYAGIGATFMATNATFHANQAVQHGGAIAAYTSTLTIDADYSACDALASQCSAFYGNTADSNSDTNGDGGAIYSNDSALNVDHTYLHRNAANHGGAIYQAGAGAVAQVANSLVYSNTSTANLGAGIRSQSGVFTVTHTTLANNVGGSGFSGVASAAYNTIAWGNSSPGFASTPVITSCNIDDGNYAGPALDPQFVAPGGGEDYYLQASSPAVDACDTGLPRDLNNRARPSGSKYDMGAYELFKYYIYLPVVMRQ